MKLIVGLGNPGRQYAGTRHNVGYELVDRVAQRVGWTRSAGDFERQARGNFDGLALDGPVTLAGGAVEKLLLLKPVTYMNLSGQSVRSAMAFYQLAAQDVLIAVDDMALPIGRLRMRPGGSHGGHNGLRDIERALGTSQYPRIRLGIGPPPPHVPWADFVLTRMTAEQRREFEPALDRGADAVMVWMNEGIEPAMSRYNAPAGSDQEDRPARDEER